MNSNLWEPAVPCNGNLGFPRSDAPAMLLRRWHFLTGRRGEKGHQSVMKIGT